MHLHTALSLLITAATSIPLAYTLGINCRGSGVCNLSLSPDIVWINDQIQALEDAKTWSNGQHIACHNQICAFLQGVEGTRTGAEVKGFMARLVEHQCAHCGSVPTEPGNDVAKGQLTVNYATNPGPPIENVL